MDQPTSIDIRSAHGGFGISISRKGAAWMASLDQAFGAGVPVTINGLQQALQGMTASFVGLSDGLAFRWQGNELRAEYVPIDGPATLMLVDRESMSQAVAQMAGSKIETASEG